MKLGWIITSTLHGSLLVAAIVSFSTVEALKMDDVTPVEVQIVSVADIEQVGKKKTKDLKTKKAIKQPIKKPEVKKLKNKAKKPEPKPKPKLKPKPKPKPKVAIEKPQTVPDLSALIKKTVNDAPTKVSNITTAVPKPLKRPPVPQKKPALKKPDIKQPKRLDDAKMSALLNKIKVDPTDEIELDFSDEETGSIDGEIFDPIEVASLSQYEFNAVKNRMQQCWSIPAGAQDAGNVIVKVGFRLNRNAQVIGTPQVLNRMADPSFGVMADAAVRAVIECGPYEMLPPEKYDVWNEFTMEFDPRAMFGN